LIIHHSQPQYVRRSLEEYLERSAKSSRFQRTARDAQTSWSCLVPVSATRAGFLGSREERGRDKKWGQEMGTRNRQVWARLWQQGLEFKSGLRGGECLEEKVLASWPLGSWEKKVARSGFFQVCVEERYTEALGGRGGEPAKNGGAKRGAK
jgi:hypothetical protein